MTFSKIVSAIATVLFATTTASAQTNYPMVFFSMSKLRQLGVSLHWDTALPNRCYNFGDGGIFISLSDELLNFYRSQGFSRRSACMALVSGIRFSPETGQRLATYVWANPKLFKNGRPDPKYWTGGIPTDLGEISEELPLSLPTCFARGLPWTDCAWRYDPMNGKRISAANTRKHAEVGSKIEDFLRGPKARQRFASDPSHVGEGGFIQTSGFSRAWGENIDDPYNVLWGDVSYKYGGGELSLFYDFSSEFPKGYGYALLYVNDGGAGPDASPESVRAAINAQRQPPPQVDLGRLKELWSAGSN